MPQYNCIERFSRIECECLRGYWKALETHAEAVEEALQIISLQMNIPCNFPNASIG